MPGFYWKLVKTGKENKEPDVIESLEEEEDGSQEKEKKDVLLAPRTDVRRHSRRIHRHSMRRGTITS